MTLDNKYGHKYGRYSNYYGNSRRGDIIINSSFITSIMINTIPRISDRKDQDFLHTVFPFTEIPRAAFSIFTIFRNYLINPARVGIERNDDRHFGRNDAFSSFNTIARNRFALKNITIPNSVTHIRDNAFYGNKINEVFIPYNVTHIERLAFKENDIYKLKFQQNKLEDEDYENIVEKKEKTLTIGDQAFQYNRINTLHLPSTVIVIGSDAFSYNEISDILDLGYYSRVPKLISIGDSAFRYNRINRLALPRSLYKIGKYAFFNNYLEQIFIPESLKEIGEYAFANISSLALYFPKRYEKNKDKIYNKLYNGNYVSENMKIEFI